MTTETEPCKPCQITRIVPTYPLFNLGCVYCGARIIQQLGCLMIPASEIKARRRENLAHWVAFGHSEAQIRVLVKLDGPAVAPPTPATPAVCAPRTHGKPR